MGKRFNEGRQTMLNILQTNEETKPKFFIYKFITFYNE